MAKSKKGFVEVNVTIKVPYTKAESDKSDEKLVKTIVRNAKLIVKDSLSFSADVKVPVSEGGIFAQDLQGKITKFEHVR